MRRLVALAVLAAAALVVAESAATVPADPTGRFPEPARVAVLVLENRSYDEVIGNPDAPYLNALARRYALATRYYAIGHPSLPKYVALLGGSTFDIHSDCNVCDIAGRSLVAQLDAAHISWKAYFEDLTASARAGVRTRLYDPHYNPFVYYESVRGSSFGRSRSSTSTSSEATSAAGGFRVSRGSRRASSTTATTARSARPTATRPSSSRASCGRSAGTASST
jgi:hypothetical protein